MLAAELDPVKYTPADANVKVPELKKLPVKYKLPAPVYVIVPSLVKSPVPLCVIPPVDNLIVPLLLTLPLTVNVVAAMFKMAPAFTVSVRQVVLTPTVTVLAPVVAMMTSSPVPGAVPPTQVLPVDHVPPVALLVRVTAFNNVTVCNNAINKTNLYVVS